MLSARARRPMREFGSRPDLPIALMIGAGGMGMALAQRMGQSHRIALASLDPDELAQGLMRLHEQGVIGTTIRCDISDPVSVTALADRLSSLGPVQSLVHVVGLAPSIGKSEPILAVNLIGAALVEEAVRPLMAPGGAGIFISSMAAHFIAPSAEVLAVLDAPLEPDLGGRLERALGTPLSHNYAYPLSKLGLNRLVRRQAFAWGSRQARIVSISPGLIDTPMGAVESLGATTRDAMRGQMPLQRDGGMAEIADAVEFLASARASYITGTDLLVDGGMTAVQG
ncbi:MAG TPA: SDR family oxidoreductase [Sphingobium sp.]|uniref:SDR family oxidoreductase n=1 Tax=Sphingobium sp. TaxID=1912891 RepID=UPI002ED377D1